MDSNLIKKLVDQLTSKLVEAGQYQQFVASFSKCGTNSERFECLYSLPQAQDLIEVRENYRPKSRKHAESWRAKGNMLFKARKYQEATDAYTQSIIMAPDDSDSLSLAYNNRSTTNFYMKKYGLCLQDIEMAFLHHYPENKCYRLHQRVGRCMYYMNQKELAIKAFQKTIASLDQAEICSKEKVTMVSDMKKAIDQCDSIQGPPANISIEGFNHCHKGIPKLSGNPSKEVPCLSECVEIRLDAHGGRGLFAKRDIQIGETLIVETPFSCALLRECNLSHCQHCCNRVALPLPCRHCSGVVFCSLSCRDAAWEKFHWAECRVLESIQDSTGDLSFLSFRTILVAGLSVLDGIQQIQGETSIERDAGFDEKGVYCSDNYRAAYHLVNHDKERTFQDLLGRTLAALFFVKHLEFSGFFPEKPVCNNDGDVDASGDGPSQSQPNDQQVSLVRQKCNVGGHLLRNNMMLPCNAHEVSEFSLNCESPAMSSTKELAAALYPVLSLINHSCDPSVVRHSFGNVCVARAIRSIKADQELKDNYGALYPVMDLATRQSHLQSQYYFTCRCEACVSNWPQYFDIANCEPVLRCSICDGRVKIPRDNDPKKARCSTCRKWQDIQSPLVGLSEMEPDFRQALTTVIDGDTSENNVTTLLNFLRFAESKMHRPWQDICDSQEAFKQCLNMQANCFPA
ncbi:SET and MYND domain-containing protein 4-like [Elysia marginata]|uniref:Protein-lysine N-methyltransferase SMYD4 n=1 Tax=Elysia marginata TaxID=1093978 RepID=A0AAV4GVS7_9GAST|nr:SET and MYND domain-containing protein 4-like [Elysia marginata]